MSHHLPYCLKSSHPQYECLRSQDEHKILLTWSAMVIIAFFFQFLSVPFLSCLRRLARKSKWAKEDKRSAANTGFTRLYPRGLFWLLVTWKPKVNLSFYQFTSSTDKNRFTTSKSVDRDIMGRLQLPNPLPHPNIHRVKWENKAKQNKINIVRYLTETKLWRNAIISLKLIDLRTGQIELKKCLFWHRDNNSMANCYYNFIVTKFNE